MPEVYSLSVNGYHENQFVQNVLHFTPDSDAGVDTLTWGFDLINSWIDTLEVLWLDCLPATYYVSGYRARRVLPVHAKTAWTSFQPGAKPGGISGGAQTLQLCPCVRLVPPMGTKTNGKIYMPAIAESSINGNVYQAGYVSAVTDFVTQAIVGASVTSILWKIAIYSRLTLAASLPTGYTLSPRIGFQARRRRPV